MDITQALKDTENALRDFISNVLRKALGDDWVTKSGVSEDRILKWTERKLAEEKRQELGAVEERLIYYADFYDLKTILRKNWSGEFSDALGDRKTVEVWLAELEKLRDPDAHRREFLPHQKHLAIGISGEIRNRLIRYRSKQETSEDYYPRFESARDSIGNIWTPQAWSPWVHTGSVLRPGDVLDFAITARDPLEQELAYAIRVGVLSPREKWQKENTFTVRIEEKHVQDNFEICYFVKSPREYHALGDYDHSISFFYKVLPPQMAEAT